MRASLLEDIEYIMGHYHYGPKDVDKVVTRNGDKVCSWKEFKKLAAQVDLVDVDPARVVDFCIIFHDGGWLETELDFNWDCLHFNIYCAPVLKANPERLTALVEEDDRLEETDA